MMRATRWASVIVALFLLTSAATAYAECAWVIWRNSLSLSKDTGDHWFPEQAVDSHRECEGVVNFKNAAEERLRNDPKVKRLMDYSWLCLPDAVDPRGPKAR
jgi:hypothetical protein